MHIFSMTAFPSYSRWRTTEYHRLAASYEKERGKNVKCKYVMFCVLKESDRMSYLNCRVKHKVGVTVAIVSAI